MSKLKYNPISRRMFIQGAGGAFMLPLLPSLLPSRAEAAEPGNQKRLIAITTPNQFPANLFFPSGSVNPTLPSDLQGLTSPISEGRFNYRSTSLADVRNVRGQVSNFIDSSLNNDLSKIALYRGVDMPGRVDHGRATSLGNIAGSHMGRERSYPAMKTMDEFLAASNNFYSGGPLLYRFPIMRLGETSISTAKLDPLNPREGREIGGNNGGLTLNGNLSLIFDKMFENMSSAVGKAPLIDRLASSVRGLQQSSKLGTRDRNVLSSYLELVNQLSLGLKNTPALPSIAKPSTTYPGFNAPGIGVTGNAADNVRDYYSNLARLIFLAIQCNSSRIFTIGINSALMGPSEVNSQDGTTSTWHGDAHNNDEARLFRAHKYVFDTVFVDLMRKLDVPEANGKTYLDNTLIWMTGECSQGHSGINFSGILAGNSANLQLGRMYDYSDWAKGSSITSGNYWVGPGQPINRFWVGILKSMGLTPSDYLSKFGNNSTTFGVWEKYAEGFEGEFGQIDRAYNMNTSLPGLFRVA